MNTILTYQFTNWKTTLAGLLNTFCALAAAGALAPNPYISTKVSGILLALVVPANVILHSLMSDVPTTTVNVPPGATGTTVNVPPASTTTVQTTPPETK